MITNVHYYYYSPKYYLLEFVEDIKGFDPTPVHSGNKLDGFAHFVHTGKCILDKSMHYR